MHSAALKGLHEGHRITPPLVLGNTSPGVSQADHPCRRSFGQLAGDDGEDLLQINLSRLFQALPRAGAIQRPLHHFKEDKCPPHSLARQFGEGAFGFFQPRTAGRDRFLGLGDRAGVAALLCLG
jgi:hypothetical protein